MFFKVEIQTMKNGTVASQPIATYEDEKDAEIAYHQAVAYNMQSETLSSFLIMIISDVGVTILKKFYNFSVPGPDTESNEE